ncbi:TPA: hypothetical protein TVE68_000969 [Streptococcus equi subsp. zooepidemicus]|nr:hypothetical protein [Streptococcus equi subsp. zooepidemicus]HEL0568699.1 hypothetical protein [Streptococcus equi subsp. zooepidemicus]HEL1050264.1 hypothetical protein [Streptococcus equi subsp. zooepidemicus]HEL1347933.1 hypothetical protein [Streptococcus equi subsp. zooepidemicus]
MLTNIKKHRSLSKLRKSTVSAVVAVSVLGAGLAMKSVEAHGESGQFITRVIVALTEERDRAVLQASKDFAENEKLRKENAELSKQLKEKQGEIVELSTELQTKTDSFNDLTDQLTLYVQETEKRNVVMASIFDEQSLKLEEKQREVTELSAELQRKTNDFDNIASQFAFYVQENEKRSEVR